MASTAPGTRCRATPRSPASQRRRPKSAWAKERSWSHIPLLSGYESSFQKDYKCQGETDDKPMAGMLVFKKQDGKIVLFWSSEGSVDMVWPYWNLMDLTPEGRPDRPTPLHQFTPEYFEKHYLNK